MIKLTKLHRKLFMKEKNTDKKSNFIKKIKIKILKRNKMNKSNKRKKMIRIRIVK
jgi:hypothetical protein